jgi:hypothetical protein
MDAHTRSEANHIFTRAVGLLFIAAVLVFSLAFVACGSDDDDADATDVPMETAVSTVEASPSPAASMTPEADVTPVFDGSRDPVSGGDENLAVPPVPLLTDVRAASHDGFDRIVFEFEDGALPGYTVEYITPPATACGSGGDLEVAGGALLQVRFYPANAHTEAGGPTVEFQELTPGLPSIVEVESACDFEAVVIWAVGLTEESDFAVTELSEPVRLVIDIAHP